MISKTPASWGVVAPLLLVLAGCSASSPSDSAARAAAFTGREAEGDDYLWQLRPSAGATELVQDRSGLGRIDLLEGDDGLYSRQALLGLRVEPATPAPIDPGEGDDYLFRRVVRMR